MRWVETQQAWSFYHARFTRMKSCSWATIVASKKAICSITSFQTKKLIYFLLIKAAPLFHNKLWILDKYCFLLLTERSNRPITIYKLLPAILNEFRVCIVLLGRKAHSNTLPWHLRVYLCLFPVLGTKSLALMASLFLQFH